MLLTLTYARLWLSYLFSLLPMTRGNINYVYQNAGEAPRTLYFYWNGDQYPTGVRDTYNALELVKNGRPTPEQFKKWAKENYDDIEVEDLGQGGQPRVYYSDGFITDYTYVFSHHGVMVWCYAVLIFDGKYEEFKRWLKNVKREDNELWDDLIREQQKIQRKIMERKQ